MYLIYDNQQNAIDDLNQANINYACPNESMQSWAEIIQKYNDNFWAFSKPDTRGGIDHMININRYIEQIDSLPNDWYPPDE